MKNVSGIENPDNDALLHKEWIVTNGLGGFASGSISGAPTRKYHGLLTCALPAPYGRVVMVNYVEDAIVFPENKEILLSPLITAPHQELLTPPPLVEFRLENGLPIWNYEFEGISLRKTLLLVQRQNTLQVSYRLLSPLSQKIYLRWRPYMNFRLSEEPVNQESALDFTFHAKENAYEITSPAFPTLRLFCEKENFIFEPHLIENIFYGVEADRGYESIGKLKSPGYFLVELHPNTRITFIASMEEWSTIHALHPEEAEIVERLRRKNILRLASPLGKSPIAAKLALAADQFIITPITRSEDMIRLQAAGEEVRSILAGFPWFTDWGRDTMISLEGLVLVTKRFGLADSILRTFSYYIKHGLIPNMFPDGELEARYNTADATLWYFHAIDRFIHYTGNDDILEILLPKLHSIIDRHINGTLYGIRVDGDGLLVQGQEGVQLTWMDAKVGDWVVTPRRGKAVEINALWYNALKLYEEWSGKSLEIAKKCRESFNERFWFEKDQYLFDVVDTPEGGNDSALRPNQLFAISLKYPVLEERYWKHVLEIVQKELLTPVGLRTLAPSHPEYKATYYGDL